VRVFDLLDHPTAMRCYAWSCETTAGKRRFQAVLRLPPVDGPIMAVRAVILAEQHAKRD
jgi:hypothetical protein